MPNWHKQNESTYLSLKVNPDGQIYRLTHGWGELDRGHEPVWGIQLVLASHLQGVLLHSVFTQTDKKEPWPRILDPYNHRLYSFFLLPT